MDTRLKRFIKENRKFSLSIVENENFEKMFVAPNVSITLLQSYPFKPPILYINDTVYTSYFIEQFKKYESFTRLHKIHITDCCICCDSIINDTTWSPCFGMYDVIQDYKKFYGMLKHLIHVKYSFDILPFDDLIKTNIISYLIYIKNE
jgi:hypothetical protein